MRQRRPVGTLKVCLASSCNYLKYLNILYRNASRIQALDTTGRLALDTTVRLTCAGVQKTRQAPGFVLMDVLGQTDGSESRR